MSELDIEQSLADDLLSLKKHLEEGAHIEIPAPGKKLALRLFSEDGRYEFIFDISCGKKPHLRVKYQLRTRNIILARLDLSGAPNENPDGERMDTPHLHIYKQGFGDRFAIPPPPEFFSNCVSEMDYLRAFGEYCNVESFSAMQEVRIEFYE